MKLARALRSLSKAPTVTFAAVATLALGIGASTAVFSVVEGVLLRPLPYPEPERIVQLWHVSESGGRGQLSHPNFQDLQERSRSFSALAQYQSSLVSISGGREPVRARRAVVSREIFDVLGVAPVVGRGFADEELRPGAPPVALVSFGFWQRHLGGDADLASHRLRLEREFHQVVGVLPPGFTFPGDTDLWVPRERTLPLPSRTAHNWHAVGRLENGVSLERARADVSAIARELHETYGGDTWMVDAALVPLHEELTGGSRPALMVLMGAVIFLLLVAVANVVNLLLARALARERETAVSAALGANRWALVEPFLTEASLLSAAGGGLGALVAVVAVRAFLAVEGGHLPRSSEIGVSLPMLGFALTLSVLTAVSLGLFAGWRATRRAARGSLHDAYRSSASRGDGALVRRGLVVSQVAITLVLLVGAGLLAQSLHRLLEVDPGFRRSGVVVMELSFPAPASEEERRELGAVHERLLTALGSLPGVARAGSVDRIPMSQGYRNGLFLKPGEGDALESFEDFARLAEDPARVGSAEYRAASPGLFETLGIPLVRGRLFDDRDDADAPHVAVISESLARDAWREEDPLGKLVEFGNMDGDLRVMRVIGVVGDVRHGGLDSEARGTLYVNALQRPPSTFAVVLDATAAAAVVREARQVARELAPEVPPRFRTIEEVVGETVASRRFSLLLVGVFALAALGLAVVGIYGVLSYGVSRRRGEIGVRVALGAAPRDVAGGVAGEGLRLVALGIAAGLAAALALTRVLQSLLFEVSPTDPATYVAISLFLVGVALAACLVPAVRAARLDPVSALHAE